MTPAHFNTYQSSYNNPQHHLAEFPQVDFGLAVPVFKQGDDPIDAINKMMSFLSTIVTSHFPSTNNQLRNSFNPRQQATIHDGRPKRKKDATWFRDKVLLVKAQGNGKVLNEEELEFLADPGIAEGPVTKSVITVRNTKSINHFKISILQVIPFEEGRLPVKYLGVPLVPSRL
ncbi:hypothetical protein Tco_0108408, partial [Tanacetum coccineum]